MTGSTAIATTVPSGWIRCGRAARSALLALAVMAPSAATAQDGRRPDDGTEQKEIEQKEIDDSIRAYQKAFDAQTRLGGDPWYQWQTSRPGEYYYSYYRADGRRIGASLHPVDDALRSHLKLPEGQGVVVVEVAEKSAAARAGIRKHDVLLSVDDRPLAKGEDLNKALKAAAGKGVKVRLIRAGGEVTVTLELDGTAPGARYVDGAGQRLWIAQGLWIGVEAADADETLRAQLELPRGKGIVVTKVMPGSPAQEAGIQVYDILLEAGLRGADLRPLASIRDLQKEVTASGGKELTLRVLRGGAERELPVTPAAAGPGTAYWSSGAVNPEWRKLYGVHYPGVASVAFSPDGKRIVTGGQDGTARIWDAATGKDLGVIGADVETELGEVLRQLEALRRTVEELRERVGKARAEEGEDEDQATESR